MGLADAKADADKMGPNKASGDKKPCAKKKKIKLVELVEVVTRGQEGTVGGPARGSKKKKRLVNRKAKAKGAYKQFINLNKDIDGSAKRHPENDRFVQLRARVEWVDKKKTESLAGKRVYWTHKLTKGENRPASLTGSEKENFYSSEITMLGSPRHSESDKDGWTTVVEFKFSQYGGDKYRIFAQADENDQGKPSGKKLKAGPYVVWRKFWAQVTRPSGTAVPKPGRSIKAFRKVAADERHAQTVKYTETQAPARTFYPEWMIRKGGGDEKRAVIGNHNRDWFYKKFRKEKRRPVKGHLIICDAQWDYKGLSWTGTTNLHTFNLTSRSEEVEFNLGAWNAGIVKPALKGNLFVSGTWKLKAVVAAGAGGLGLRRGVKREGNLTDANIKVEKTRSDLNFVKVVLPADAPDPTLLHHVEVKLKLRYGKYYAGESNKHQMLIKYTKGHNKAFNQVVSHEFGHGFGQVPKTGQHSTSLGDHPNQYTDEHGGQGSHCSTDKSVVLHGDYPAGLYQNGTCIMFHQINPGGCKHLFCNTCDPYLRIQDMSKLE